MRATTIKRMKVNSAINRHESLWEICYFIEKKQIDSHLIKDSLLAHEYSEAFLKGDYWTTIEGQGVYFDPQLLIKHTGDSGVYMGNED